MAQVDVAELQVGFEDLLKRARSGEVVVIFNGGEPVARLTPLPTEEEAQRWKPKGEDFADRARQIREYFDLGAPKMTEEEVQAEWDGLRGRN